MFSKAKTFIHCKQQGCHGKPDHPTHITTYVLSLPEQSSIIRQQVFFFNLVFFSRIILRPGDSDLIISATFEFLLRLRLQKTKPDLILAGEQSWIFLKILHCCRTYFFCLNGRWMALDFFR